jgi:hypothetical protein
MMDVALKVVKSLKNQKWNKNSRQALRFPKGVAW